MATVDWGAVATLWVYGLCAILGVGFYVGLVLLGAWLCLWAQEGAYEMLAKTERRKDMLRHARDAWDEKKRLNARISALEDQLRTAKAERKEARRED